MSINKRTPLNWAGDTIVEVLIVVVVIATVLASGYVIAVSSLQSIQLTQERTYALKKAEGQMENLKAAAAKDPTFINTAIANTVGFCLDSALTSYSTGASPTADPTVEVYTNYGTHCKEDPNDLVNNSCTAYCYYFAIKPVPTDPNDFLVSVRWYGPQGTLQQVQLFYRLY